MLGTSCSLEISEIVLAEHRNPEETEEGMVLTSLKDASSSSVSTVSVKMESGPSLKVQVGRGLVLTPCL